MNAMRVLAKRLSESEARVAALEAALRKLHSEVDCRIEHGAQSNGHLEYVRDRLRAALAQGEKA